MSALTVNSWKCSLVVFALILFVGCGKKHPLPEESTRTPTVAALPSTKVTEPEVRSEITGGAWYRKSNGGSEIIRGMEVMLIKDKLTIKDCRKNVYFISKSCEVLVSLLARHGGSVLYEDKKDELEALSAKSKNLSKKMDKLLLQSDDFLVDFTEIYSARLQLDALFAEDEKIASSIPGAATLVQLKHLTRLETFLSDHFYELATSQNVQSTKTSIDGKYKMSEITCGSYILYGYDSSDRHILEWIEPIVIRSNSPLQRDLSTDNASLVFAKP